MFNQIYFIMTKKFFFSSILLVCLSSVMVLITSCGEDVDWEPAAPYFRTSIDNSTLPRIPATGGTVEISIDTNCNWSVNYDKTNAQTKQGTINPAISFKKTFSSLTIIIPSAPTTLDITYHIYLKYDEYISDDISYPREKYFTIQQDGASDNNTGGGNNNTGGSSGGENNNTGGENNNTGGSSGSGNTTTKPSAPTNVTAENYGNVSIPDVRITWSSVSGATGYYVYRSTSANGTYSKIGTTSNSYLSDSNVKVGNTYYYKVKAYNSVGTSDYSSYAKFEFKDTRKPGPVTYGNCTVSGSTMTLRWSVPTHDTYGKPTKAILRVFHPTAKEYVDLQTLSGTATSASFAYGPWTDSDGFVRAGIILENENGTGGGTAKIYDTKNKKWIN